MTEIGPIAVHPDYQGKGVGKQLMTTIESRAKGGKCTVGIVSCRTDVIPFFEKLGYEVSDLVFLSSFMLYSAKSGTAKVFLLQFVLFPFFSSFQRMISKSLNEVGKLYPDDLGEKIITRKDIELVILMKKKDNDGFGLT